MTADPIQWDDATPDPEEEYQALLRALRWAEGFGLLFVRCSPVEGQALINRVTIDAPQKRVTTLALDGTDWNFYEQVKQLPDRDNLDIVFVTGLETLLDEYLRPGYGSQGDYYAQDNVPRILSHLNLRRETLRDEFNICFIFLLPLYALKYIIRRAPDFFDWRSGVFEFIPDAEIVERESSRLLLDGDYEKYQSMTPLERRQCFLEIQTWLEENQQNSEQQVDLLIQQGRLFYTDQDYQSAIASYNQALKLMPDKHDAWVNRGNALFALGRHDEAIASHDEALNLNPDKHEAWNNRGGLLFALGRMEEAIASFDQALEIKPDKSETWYNRGIALSALGRNDEALASYDQAIEIKPYTDEAWVNRGVVLWDLGRTEEAIASYEQALEINPNQAEAWIGHGFTLSGLGQYEEAIAAYDQALKIKPDKDKAWYNRGNALYALGQYEKAIKSYDQALELKPGKHEAWNSRGISLTKLKHDEEAIKSYDQALELKPDKHEAWYNRGNSLANLERYEEAIASHKEALRIRRQNGDRLETANSLLALSRLYQQCGQIKKGYAASIEAAQILQELNLPIESMPYPGWLKRTLKFAERGKFYLAICIVLGIFAFPFVVVAVIFLLIWKVIRAKLGSSTR